MRSTGVKIAQLCIIVNTCYNKTLQFSTASQFMSLIDNVLLETICALEKFSPYLILKEYQFSLHWF